MSGLCADAGGGGTREGLGNEMHKLGRTCPTDTFLTTTCSHYGFNLMMASPCEKYFGDGGISSRNLLQLLYTCYVIQKLHEMNEFCQI